MQDCKHSLKQFSTLPHELEVLVMTFWRMPSWFRNSWRQTWKLPTL